MALDEKILSDQIAPRYLNETILNVPPIKWISRPQIVTPNFLK
jgi:hypothetical protein